MADENKETVEITADNFKEMVDQVKAEYEAKLKASEDARKADAKEYASSILNNQHEENDAGDEDPRHGLPSGKEMKKIYMDLDPVLTTNLDRMTCLMNWRDAELLDDPDNDICVTKVGKDGAFSDEQMSPELPVIPREKPHTGATARENPRDSTVIARLGTSFPA